MQFEMRAVSVAAMFPCVCVNILTVHISDIMTFAADAVTWEGVECALGLMQALAKW